MVLYCRSQFSLPRAFDMRICYLALSPYSTLIYSWFARYVIAVMLVVIKKGFSLAPFVNTTNMAAMSLSFGSLGIGCKPPITRTAGELS